jgi:hypothetical protein
MLPVGTEVCYDGMYGHVRFVCGDYMTVCIREFPNERVRDVCLIVTQGNYHKITLVNGNNQHEQ